MLSPTVFGLKSYEEIIDVLKSGEKVKSRMPGVLTVLEPESEDFFRLANLDIDIPLSIEGLNKVFKHTCVNRLAEGKYAGFRVVNESGVSITGNKSDVYDYDESLRMIKEADSKAYLVPIPKGRAAEFTPSDLGM